MYRTNAAMMLALVFGATAALAQAPQASSPMRNVTKTLLASEAQKECIALNDAQRLYYRYRADGPLDFKIAHQEAGEVVDLRRTGAGNAAGSFAPDRSADYCLVWSNTGARAVTLSYEFQRGPR